MRHKVDKYKTDGKEGPEYIIISNLGEFLVEELIWNHCCIKFCFIVFILVLVFEPPVNFALKLTNSRFLVGLPVQHVFVPDYFLFIFWVFNLYWESKLHERSHRVHVPVCIDLITPVEQGLHLIPSWTHFIEILPGSVNFYLCEVLQWLGGASCLQKNQGGDKGCWQTTSTCLIGSSITEVLPLLQI